MISVICSIMVPSRFGDFHGKYREKNEITRVIRSVLVPSRFCEIDGKYHEKNRQCVLFVASWYWAVLADCVENTLKN